VLLFRPEYVAPILAGTKTQTRRLGPRRWKVGSVHQARTNMNRDSTFALLTITGVRSQRVSAISVTDARAEGFPTRAAFLKAWRTYAGGTTTCWVVEFDASPQASPPVP
jgi:hypothetical protein